PVPTLRCEADVVFPRQKVAVFIDGCFWHGCAEHGRKPKANGTFWAEKIARNQSRDRRNDQALTDAGWVVVRAWEHEQPGAVVRRIEDRLRPGG
ncbi:MAG: very short patch repair endonuclease, partial [Solirubrobacterales bacterium]